MCGIGRCFYTRWPVSSRVGGNSFLAGSRDIWWDWKDIWYTLMKTLGEYRVGIDLNTSGSPEVDEIKKMTANLIDLCYARSSTTDPEVGRLWFLAMTHFEDAAMWAVKASTKRAR